MKKIILVIALLLISGPSFASEKTIIAAADPWPPFVDPSHPKEGLSLEVIRAALKTQGYIVKMEYVPWERAERGVKDGKYDILPDVWVTDKRKQYLRFSDSYAINRIKFIKKADDPFEYNGIKSLEGKTIGTIRGYGYGNEFMNSKIFKKDDVGSLISNIKKLLKKRIDLTLEDEIVARVTIANFNPAYLNKIRFAENALSSNSLHIASGLKNPRHKEIITSFNKGLKAIKLNGKYDKILSGFFDNVNTD